MSWITVLYSVFPLPGMIYAFAAFKLGRHCDPWPSGDLCVCHAMTKIHGPVIAANTPNLRHRKTHIKYRDYIYIYKYTSHHYIFFKLRYQNIWDKITPFESFLMYPLNIKSFLKSLYFSNFTLIHTLRFTQSFWMAVFTLEVRRGSDNYWILWLL